MRCKNISLRYNTKFHGRSIYAIMYNNDVYKEWKKGHIDSERKCK